MKPKNLIYTFVSYASYYDTPWGQGIAIEGIDRTAALAHQYGIPVTWIVNGRSVPMLKDRIVDWHDRFGDDVILQCPFFVEDTRGSKELFKEAIASDWRIVQEAFPWVTTKVAARGKICNELIEALEELDFQGMWGYCWEQVWWDGITHKGIPWGSWYVDSSRYKVPHTGKGKVVAFEWTARDLNATYHSGSPVIYSTDPNDVLRAGLCTGDDIEYWKNLFQDYLKNTEWNEHVYFLQQQEAHEMEYTERFAVFPASHVDECANMLDKFFSYITEYPITLTTVPEASRLYHASNKEGTAPVYMLTDDTIIRPEVNEYTVTLGGTGCGPYPETLLYYDHECQLSFVKGQCGPHRLRSYIGKGDMADEFEEESPQVFVSSYEKSDERISMTFEIGHWRRLPYGLTYWDELNGYEIESCSEEVEAHVLGGKLAFLRFGLTGQPMKIELSLVKKL